MSEPRDDLRRELGDEMLAEQLLRARDAWVRPVPDEVAQQHLAVMLEVATAPRSQQDDTVVPLRRRSAPTRGAGRRGAVVTALRVSGYAAAIAVVATFGLASLGTLPASAQLFVAETVAHLGIELPRPVPAPPAGGTPGDGIPGDGEAPGRATADDPPARSTSGPEEVDPDVDGAPATPGDGVEVPGQGGEAPGRAETTPGLSGKTPSGPEDVPGAGTSRGPVPDAPGQAGTSPGHGGSSPGQAGTSPGQAGTTPGQVKDEPADEPTSTDDDDPEATERRGTGGSRAGRSPGNSVTAPGQSTTSPDRGTTSPRDVAPGRGRSRTETDPQTTDTDDGTDR